MKKIGITIDEELLERIDNCADENYMSRSGLISLACSQFVNASDCTKAVLKLSILMQKIADNGNVDADTLEDLKQLENLAKALSSFTNAR